MLGAGRIWAVAAILGGSWGEMGMDGCSGKSCPSDSEMYSAARAQHWDGDVFWDGERWKHQLGCESQPTLVLSLGAVCPMVPAQMDPRLVKLSLGTALSPQKHCFPLHTLPAGFCSLLTCGLC